MAKDTENLLIAALLIAGGFWLVRQRRQAEGTRILHRLEAEQPLVAGAASLEVVIRPSDTFVLAPATPAAPRLEPETGITSASVGSGTTTVSTAPLDVPQETTPSNYDEFLALLAASQLKTLVPGTTTYIRAGTTWYASDFGGQRVYVGNGFWVFPEDIVA